MIIILLALFAILTFVTLLVLKSKTARIIGGILSSLGLIATVTMITLNFTDHFGMREIETVKTVPVYSAGDPRMPQGMVIAEPVGTAGNHFVMVYRDKADSKKPEAHFIPDKSQMIEAAKRHATYDQKRNTKTAEVAIKTTRLEWENDFMKLLFSASNQAGNIVREEAIVHLPSDWIVMNQKQAQKMMANHQ